MTHVTVLLAVHNGAATVQRSIDSVRSQSHDDWDLLIVDDASTDGTASVLADAAASEPRISILRNETNVGLAASLNRGWQAAPGDLIARLDADDVCLPDRLEAQVRFLAGAPEIDVLGGGAELVDETGETIGTVLRPEHHGELAAAIYRENPFIHPSVMIRRRFLEALGGYDEGCRRGQDYELWCRGYRKFRFHNLPRPLIRYTVRDRLSWNAIRAGSALTLRLGLRERRPLTGAWYAARYFASNALNRLGLRRGSLARRAA